MIQTAEGRGVKTCGHNASQAPLAPTGFVTCMQAGPFLSGGLVAVSTRGMTQRLLLLVGLCIASLVYAVLTNGLAFGKPIDLSRLADSPWFGLPHFAAPVFTANAMLLIVPAGVVHAYKNVGTEPGIVFNCPNRHYKGPGKSQPVDEIRHEEKVGSPFRIE